MQIIEGCLSTELRNRLLEKEDMSLDQVEKLARTLESVTQQSGAITRYSVPQSVQTPSISMCRTPHTKKQKIKGKQASEKAGNTYNAKKSSGSSTKFFCFCCGNENHRPRDPKCPTQTATCSKCKKKSHFAKVCSLVSGRQKYFSTFRSTFYFFPLNRSLEIHSPFQAFHQKH